MFGPGGCRGGIACGVEGPMSDELSGVAAQQGDLWGDAGRNWAGRFAPMFAPVWSAAHDLARVTEGTRLLDVGCGSGGALRMARLRGAETVGLDAAPELLEIATERLPGGELRRGDMENLPFEDGSFDAVTGINCIMYADDPGRALREARRVLTPDGRLAMAVWSDPAECEFRHVIEALRGVLPSPPPGEGPFELSGPDALEAAMKEHGFDPTDAMEVPTPFRFVDENHFVQAVHGTGPGQAVRRQVGEDAMTDALLDVGEQFRRADGSFHLENSFRVVGAGPSMD